MNALFSSVVYAGLRFLQHPHNNRANSDVSSMVLLMGLWLGSGWYQRAIESPRLFLLFPLLGIGGFDNTLLWQMLDVLNVVPTTQVSLI